jgi:hypothetical protein
MKPSVETEAVYVGGSQDGKLVRPSLVKDLITFNQTHLPVIHREYFFDGDYPFGVNEYYHYEENNGKVVFKLGKTEKVEINDI